MTDRRTEALAILRSEMKFYDLVGPATWESFRRTLKRSNWPSDARGRLKASTWRSAWRVLKTRLIMDGWVEEDSNGSLFIIEWMQY